MEKVNWYRKVQHLIRTFLPLQIVLIQLKHNLFPILLWVGFFLIVNDSLGYSFGIPFLFLSPEYLGGVNASAFMILGFAFGGFIMGFNTYSYMRLGPHFPFLTTIDKPFLKFCFNNALIPLFFVLFFTYRIIMFQAYDELRSFWTILFYITSMFGGLTIFLTLSFYYFFRLSKRTKQPDALSDEPISSPFHKSANWYHKYRHAKNRNYIYIGKGFRLMRSRSMHHFDQELVEKVFARNRINSSIYEVLTVISFFTLGAFNNFEIFEVPAAASIVLLMTICLMLFSALHSWFRGWIYLIIIVVIFSMNYLSTRTHMFHYSSLLYGLDYQKDDNYSIPRIKELSGDEDKQAETKKEYIERLNAWKEQTHQDKPKLIIINTSGGGSRSALWTMVVLQEANKNTDGRLFENTHLITGASGGMIGAAYFREIYLRYKKGEIKDLYNERFVKNIGKDMLNRLAFMASTNDIFIRYQKYNYNNYTYTKDRGYAFEEQLHKNTEHFLDHNLSYYIKPEKEAVIPTMIFTPTIINDGRRMIIGTQNMSFLNEKASAGLNSTDENIDIHSLLKSQNTMETRFSSILRANATFPFVMPMVTIPTNPEVQLMDAGIRDNYGFKTMIEFLNSMKDWIHENTSGVIVLQIRDTKNILDNQTYRTVSLVDKLTLPFGNMYKNFPRVQDYNQEEVIGLGSKAFDFPIEILSFNLRQKENDRISLSWHLTKEEKKRIAEAMNTSGNQSAMNKLMKILR